MIGFYKRFTAVLALGLVIGLIAHDSWPHFDKSIIQIKRNHKSAQRNWHIFYGQRFVYLDSSFRYQNDFNRISSLIEPGHLVLSDHATSYYASSSFPMYARNVHRHHGRSDSKTWEKLLDTRSACYLGVADHFSRFEKFLDQEILVAKPNLGLSLRYAIANKDTKNLNLRYDCLWNGREGFIANIERLATLKYNGEFINLYEFDTD